MVLPVLEAVDMLHGELEALDCFGQLLYTLYSSTCLLFARKSCSGIRP